MKKQTADPTLKVEVRPAPIIDLYVAVQDARNGLTLAYGYAHVANVPEITATPAMVLGRR